MEFSKVFENEAEKIKTENGATAYSTTKSAVLDLFALGGSYRNRDDAACIALFDAAMAENEALALKCLFYLRDIIGGKLVA